MCDFNEIYTENIEDTPTVLTELYKLNKKVDEYIENHGYGTIIKDDGTPIPSIELNNSPSENSQSLVKSGGIYSALQQKQDNLSFDDTPTENSENPVKSGGVYSALANKQDTLTFDNTPTEDSDNPVKSGGVYSALALKQDKFNIYQHNIYVISTDWRIKLVIINNNQTEFTATTLRQWFYNNGFSTNNIDSGYSYPCSGGHRSSNFSAYAVSSPSYDDFKVWRTATDGTSSSYITINTLIDVVKEITL